MTEVQYKHPLILQIVLNERINYIAYRLNCKFVILAEILL